MGLTLQVLTLLSVWVLAYHVLKQRGRMLLRLDNLEAISRLGSDNKIAQAVPRGLAVGTVISISAPLFDVDGRTVSLRDFQGKYVLLICWSPSCGYCSRIAPELALLQRELDERQVKLVFISYGTPEANRQFAEQYGLNAPVLLIGDGSDAPECFKTLGTPSAYLLDEEGKVASPLAVGADQVPTLARTAAGNPKRKRLPGERPLSESRIQREGLTVGTQAPLFTLPDVNGNRVSLEQYRGRKVLLVFSDPHCGPCEELAPRLAKLDRQHRNNGLQVVIVSRGDAEENRHKVEQHHLEFPVVLQRTWEISRQYGIFATPVAFLISEDGRIERNVAQGSDAILSLATGE